MDIQSKYISVEQALSMVKSDDVIVTGLGASEAGLFMGQLHTIADRVRNVTVTNCLPIPPRYTSLSMWIPLMWMAGSSLLPSARPTLRATWLSSPTTCIWPPPSVCTM